MPATWGAAREVSVAGYWVIVGRRSEMSGDGEDWSEMSGDGGLGSEMSDDDGSPSLSEMSVDYFCKVKPLNR